MVLKNSLNLFRKLNSFRNFSINSVYLNHKALVGEFQDPLSIKQEKKDFFQELNKFIDRTKNDRNFAVIHLYGYQHFVHEGDIIQIKNDLPINLGEKVKIEKCLLAGNENITLIGRPLLDRDNVNIIITPIEKTQSYTHNNHIITKRSSRKRRWRFDRYPITFIRINEISIKTI